jgi:hypothetical protein
METTDRNPRFTQQVVGEAKQGATTSAQVVVLPQTVHFTREQRVLLNALQARYRQDPDLFSDRELSRLRFVRWLYQNGRIGS